MKLKSDMITRVTQILTNYVSNEEVSSIRYKLFQFVFDIKHNLGSNRFNHSLADNLFSNLSRAYRPIKADLKLDRVLINHLSRDIKEGILHPDIGMEQTVLRVISYF